MAASDPPASVTDGAPGPGKKTRRAQMRRMASLLEPYVGRWLLATLALLGGSAVNLALPQAVRVAVDDAVTQKNAAALDGIMVWAFVGFAVLALLAMARNYLMTWLGARVVADLRAKTFEALLMHPPGFFQERKSGELVSRLTGDIQMLHHAVGSELSIAIRSVLTVTGGLVLLVWTNPMLTLVMIAVVPPLALAAVWVGKRIRKAAREVQDRVAEANSGLKEAVVGIETVQAFTAEPVESRRYSAKVFSAFRTQLKVALARAGFIGGATLAAYGSIAVILWMGGAMVIDGDLSGGDLASFLIYTILVTGGLTGLAEIWTNLQSALGATGRVFDLMDEVPTVRNDPDAIALPEDRIEGRVVFEGVRFHYPSRPEVEVLGGVSFTAHPGEVIALVGPSGAGKSTIAKLVHRFYDPDEGRVTLDGNDLRKVDLEDLRRAVGSVEQEPILFSGTIAENIAYADPDADLERIKRAAREAYIADFIEDLPDGYDTLVGERGVKLSGGQRQRLAIARALLKDPRILVLDEATSHLDTENEALVHKGLLRLMEGRTTLVIAHRLSTVKNADRILVLDSGAIVEQGSHAELSAHGDVYRRLTAAQALSA